MALRVAVVGAGLAGLRAAESVLRSGLEAEVVVLGDEPHLPYSRPPLSKELLTGPGEPTFFRLPSDDRLSWRTSAEVVGADLSAGLLQLAGGEEIDFDGLVVATGVRARRLPLAGPPPLTLRTLDHLAELRSAVRTARSAVLVGGGVLGCELASSLRALGLSVDVVVGPDDLPMQSLLGPRLAAEMMARHEREGTVFHRGCAVIGYSEAGVWLSDGRCLEADVVVETVGALPNTEWLAGNGLDLGDGVLCGPDLGVVGARAVVACGDVARFPSPRFGGRLIRVEHWSLAAESGRRAGRTLARQLGAGVPDEGQHDPLPTFWSDQVGVRLSGLGLPGLAGARGRLVEGELAAEPVLDYRVGDDLVGVVVVDRPDLVAGYRSSFG